MCKVAVANNVALEVYLRQLIAAIGASAENQLRIYTAAVRAIGIALHRASGVVMGDANGSDNGGEASDAVAAQHCPYGTGSSDQWSSRNSPI